MVSLVDGVGFLTDRLNRWGECYHMLSARIKSNMMAWGPYRFSDQPLRRFYPLLLLFQDSRVPLKLTIRNDPRRVRRHEDMLRNDD